MSSYRITEHSCDNRHAALRGISVDGATVLEIGPLNRPLVRKERGRVYYADHDSAKGLRQKYATDPAVDVSQIVEIDFDLSRAPLIEAARGVAPFDIVVASHVIEHVPDLIEFLKETNTLLRPGGILALVVPDKRFTFDLHRRETPMVEIEAAHAERRTRPSLGTVIDYAANIVTVDAGALWRHYTIGRDAPRMYGPTTVAQFMRQWEQGAYIDAHCWVFTPWSFLITIGHLVEKHVVDYGLRLAESTPRGQLEFYIQLEKGRPTSDWATAAIDMADRAERPAP